MNKNINFKNKIIEFFKQPLVYIIFICILFQMIIYNTVPKSQSFADTDSYIESSEQINITKGIVNDIRTPIYPYFIKIIRKIGGDENLFNNIALVQKMLFFITLILFYYSLKLITKNKIILSILTLIFGISPFIILWNVAILTESLAIMEMVILTLLTISYLKKPGNILAGSLRISNINYDYDKTIIYIFITNLFIILDFKIFL